MKLSNKVYDALKWVALWMLPALATLWLTLGKIWNFPFTTEIGATITAIDVFLAAILDISKKNYTGDGAIVVNTQDPEKDLYTLNYDGNIGEIADKKTVTFKVVNEDTK